MLASENYCAIEGNRGYKWPTLSELHFKLFGSEVMRAHNALSDVKATAKCFWKLKELDIVSKIEEKIENHLMEFSIKKT